MTYRPADAVFGPPFSVRLPSLVYLGVALIVSTLVLVGERSPANSWLHDYVVAQNVGRVISSRTLALALILGAISSAVRTSMRGVRVRGDGVDYKEVVALWPRVRRYKWAQIDRISLTTRSSIILDLWDGTHAVLPAVRDQKGLGQALERVAYARAIPVLGGAGLDDIPESRDFAEQEET